MADLSFLAAGSQESSEPIKRTAPRERQDNPFEGKLNQSWDSGTFDAKRNRGKGAYVGATLELTTYKGEDTTAVVRAVRRAADALDLGVEIVAPSEDYTDDKGKSRTRYVAGLVKYRAMERRTHKAKGEGEPEPEQKEEENEEENEPANV